MALEHGSGEPEEGSGTRIDTSEGFWRKEERTPEEKARMAALARAHRDSLEEASGAHSGEAGACLAEVLQAVGRSGYGACRPTGTSRTAGGVRMFETRTGDVAPGLGYELRDWYGLGRDGIYRVGVQWGEGMETVVIASVLSEADACWFDDSVGLFVFWLSQSDQRCFTTAAHLRYLRVVRGDEGYAGLEPLTPDDLALRAEILDGHLELAMQSVAEREASGALFERIPRTGYWYEGSLPDLKPPSIGTQEGL